MSRIDSIAAPDLFVAGHTIVTDSGTTIERGDTHVTLADLAVGDTVQVEGVLQADRSVYARGIEVGGERDGDEEDQAEP